MLEKEGLPVTRPWLPTCHLDAFDNPGSIDFYSDSDAIQDELRTLIDDQGKDVLVLAHSYGGAPATDAITHNLCAQSRREDGKPGGVIGMMAMTAMMIMPGQSIEEAFGGVAPFVDLHVRPNHSICSIPKKIASWLTPKQPNGTISAKDAASIMFSDLNNELQAKYTSMLVLSTRAAHTRKLRHAPYQHIPIRYMLTEKDNAVPLFLQELLVAKLQEVGAQTSVVKVDAGHSPYLSKPEMVVNAVVDMVKSLSIQDTTDDRAL